MYFVAFLYILCVHARVCECVCVNTGVLCPTVSLVSLVPLVFQVDAGEARGPVIKKSLFPLYNSKLSFKHNSSERVLPLVATPMVQMTINILNNNTSNLTTNLVPIALHAINIINPRLFGIDDEYWRGICDSVVHLIHEVSVLWEKLVSPILKMFTQTF